MNRFTTGPIVSAATQFFNLAPGIVLHNSRWSREKKTEMQLEHEKQKRNSINKSCPKI